MYGTLTTTVNNAFMTDAAFNAPGATPNQLLGGSGGGGGMSFGQGATIASGLFDFFASQSQASTMRDIADQQYQINLADIERSKKDLASKRLASFRAMQTSVGQNQVNYGYGMAGSKSAARVVAMTSAARDVRDYQGRASDAAAIARARNNAAMAKYNAYADAASTQMGGVGSLIGSFASAFA